MLPWACPACPQQWDALLHLGGLVPVPCILLRGSSWDIKCHHCREKYKWKNPGKLVLPLRPVPAAGRRLRQRSSLGKGIKCLPWSWQPALRGGRRAGNRQRAMASMGMQVLGIALSVIGWLASILCCALPMWRETAFVGNNIVVAQIIWEGLWMSCVVQSTGQMQCKVYDSLLALPQDLQAARAMVVVAIVLAILGTLLAVTGGKCTNCVEDDTAKAKVMILSGIIFIVAGILILIPISWSANSIIQDFYNPLVSDSQKRDLGSSLYVGWAASALLLLGGGILCCTCPPRGEKPYSAKFTAARSLPASNYV
ncbi:claudin-4-like [Agelaius phoeniceus]|uniref:claudin-4-like n=1 Tax=Agelaius phoeniceus TaxID=39638 RepID=UPI004055070F